MGIEDEKTRPVKAVKRKITEVETRQVKAVKRAPKEDEPEPFDGFRALGRVEVLKRGALLNHSGGKDNGWSFREPGEKKGLVWFAGSEEKWLTTLSRAFTLNGYDFDVMCDGQCVAVFHVEPFQGENKGWADLKSLDGQLIATISLEKAFDAKGKDLIVQKRVRDELDELLCGRRLVCTKLKMVKEGILVDDFEPELTFENGASGYERLCVLAMIVLQEAWRIPRWENKNSKLTF